MPGDAGDSLSAHVELVLQRAAWGRRRVHLRAQDGEGEEAVGWQAAAWWPPAFTLEYSCLRVSEALPVMSWPSLPVSLLQADRAL